jgi:hypothetical protein
MVPEEVAVEALSRVYRRSLRKCGRSYLEFYSLGQKAVDVTVMRDPCLAAGWNLIILGGNVYVRSFNSLRLFCSLPYHLQLGILH